VQGELLSRERYNPAEAEAVNRAEGNMYGAVSLLATSLVELMTYGGLRQLGLAQHHHRVTIKFLAGTGHPELS
jgi:hypothetical protein